jgi:hypothetical protein
MRAFLFSRLLPKNIVYRFSPSPAKELLADSSGAAFFRWGTTERRHGPTVKVTVT